VSASRLMVGPRKQLGLALVPGRLAAHHLARVGRCRQAQLMVVRWTLIKRSNRSNLRPRAETERLLARCGTFGCWLDTSTMQRAPKDCPQLGRSQDGVFACNGCCSVTYPRSMSGR
jgi:hypothetical protein